MSDKKFFGDEGVAHSSTRHDWGTPQDLYDSLDAEFGFTVDVCANKHNAKHERFFSPEIDGLKQDWSGEVCFMNPPFGRSMRSWIKKAYDESLRGAVVVAVIPARTDTSYWHDFIQDKAEVRFIRGRLKYDLYGVKSKPAPFPSCVVIWR